MKKKVVDRQLVLIGSKQDILLALQQAAQTHTFMSDWILQESLSSCKKRSLKRIK